MSTDIKKKDEQKKTRKRKKKTWQKVLSVVAYLMMFCGVLCFVMASVPTLTSALSLLFNYNTMVEDPDSDIVVDPDATMDEELIVPSTDPPFVNEDPKATAVPGAVDFTLPDFSSSGIINIAVFGVDSRDPTKFSGLSDVIMILSLDTVNNTMKLTSIMRDLLVNIPGKGYSKINAAFAYGGPQLAMQTIADNFGIQIDNYVVVNFAGAKDIVNQLGGVDVTMSAKEVAVVREMGYRATQLNGDLYHLEGDGALEFMRIRKIDSDKYRTQRQARVMQSLMDKYSSLSMSEVLELMNTLTGYVRTDMSLVRLTSIVSTMYQCRAGGLNHDTYPFKHKGFNYKGQSCVVEDTRYDNIIKLYQRIYSYTPQFH